MAVTPCSPTPPHRTGQAPLPVARRTLLLVGGILAGLGLVAIAIPRRADASVVHRAGYPATVLGWTSWYGSYELVGLGQAWCIDHGLQAPDAVFGYQPVDVPERTADAQAAMAWLVSTHGPGADATESAAIMLVLHDLAGAIYPYGRLDVDRLQPGDLAGFNGQEAQLLTRVRALKAEALTQAWRRGPLHLALALAPAPGGGTVVASVTDAEGRPVPDLLVTLTSEGHAESVRTTTNGTATHSWASANGFLHVEATATVADPALHAFAPSQAAAQRVALPATVTLHAVAKLAPPSPTTSTTTTTPPPPPTVTTTTTTPPPTPPPAPPAPPDTAPPAPPDTPDLPRTGTPAAGLASLAVGLLCMGTALQRGARARTGQREGGR